MPGAAPRLLARVHGRQAARLFEAFHKLASLIVGAKGALVLDRDR